MKLINLSKTGVRLPLMTASLLAGAMLAFVALLLALMPRGVVASTSTALSAVASESSMASALCADNGAIPEAECNVLVALYESTSGDQWTDNENWLSADPGVTPCDWHGVTCKNGHVTELLLSRNGLRGRIPDELAALDGLARLQLENNSLGGTVGSSLCQLVDTLQTVDLDYNRIAASGNRSQRCLDQLDPGWSATQTVAPNDLKVASTGDDALDLTWMPIDYVEDGGYYAITYATSRDGPFTVHGQTTDKGAAAYRVDGLEPGRTYYLRVRSFTPSHGDQPEDQWSADAWTKAATSSSKTVLLAVYFGADNDLDSYARPILDRLTLGSTTNPNVTVVALFDRLGEDNTGVWTIASGTAIPDSGFLDSLGVTEVDTADPDVLAAFLRYARSVTSADVEIASIIGHGVGLAPDLAWYPDSQPGGSLGTPSPGIPPLPRPKESTPTDVTSGSYMSTPALGRALAAATDEGADPFDLIFFDQCFAGNLDVLYEVRNAAKVFVASPNYAWLAAPYGRYLAEFSPLRTPEQMAGAIIEVYQRSLNDRHPNAILAIRSEDIARVAASLDDLALRLMAALNGGQAKAIAEATRNSRYADTTQCGRGNLSLGPPDEMIGVGVFAAGLQRSFGIGDAFGVHDTAGQLIVALEEVRSTYRVGYPYIEPDEFWDYDDTLTILAPLPRTTRPDVAWRASIYGGDVVGKPAIWTPDPSQTVVVSTPFAYVMDGRWDEFIDLWYTEPMTPTVGEWCNYTPPSLVVSDTVELLSLGITSVGGTNVKLSWSEAIDDEPTTYHVYGRESGDIGWHQLAVVDAPATETEVTDLATGEHRFIVAAGNGAGTLFAKSDTVDWTVSDALRRIFLPAIWR